MRVALAALGCVFGAVILAVFGLFVVAFSAGPSVAAGERAAIVALALDGVLWLASVVGFWLLSRTLSPGARIAATLGVGIATAIGLAAVFLFTLILLNR